MILLKKFMSEIPYVNVNENSNVLISYFGKNTMKEYFSKKGQFYAI